MQAPDSHQESLTARVRELEAELQRVNQDALRVAEANARAAVEMAQRNAELEEQRERLASTLEEARVAAVKQEKFIAKARHEVSMPLKSIAGTGEALLSTKLSTAQQDHVETIVGSVRTLFTIIEDLTARARSGSGKIDVVPATFDLWATAEEVIRMTLHESLSKGLKLELEVDSSAPRYVVCDRDHVQRVLLILVGNAIKNTELGSVRLILEASASGQMFQCRVVDSGPGMTPEALKHVFDPSAPREPKGENGSADNLAQSHRLARVMGGNLTAISRPGSGATFALSLPIKTLAETPTPAEPTIAYDVVHICLSNQAQARQIEGHIQAKGCEVRVYGPGEIAPADLTSNPGRQLVLGCFGALGRHTILKLANESLDPDKDGLAILTKGGVELPWLPENTWQLQLPLRYTDLYKAMSGEAPSRRTSHRSVPAAATTAVLRGIRVLIAEDNEINQRVAAKLLERIGCQVTVASSGQECIDLAVAELPDLILMDCEMPGMSGYEAAEALREIKGPTRSIPIIALTGHEGDEARAECLASGMDDHLAKPLDTGVLGRALLDWTLGGGRESRTVAA